jgi:hypothetical protein
MPERLKYSHLFKGNPFRGNSPTEAFSLLHWGNTHERTYTIDAPEPLIMLGMMKLLRLVDRQIQFEKGEAFLAVGHKTNTLYIIPRVNDAPLEVVPPFSTKTFTRIGQIQQTDYWSAKGGKADHHYYHKHEPPFPTLWLSRAAGVGYIRAANNKGQPSYAVGREGIVG